MNEFNVNEVNVVPMRDQGILSSATKKPSKEFVFEGQSANYAGSQHIN